MIKAGFDLNRDRDKFGNGFAHIAADRGNLSLLQLLVDHEADVNLKNWHGDTVLLRTLKACLERCKGVCSGHLSCFRFLLQLPDTDSNISDDDDFTPMKFALKPKSRQFSASFLLLNSYFFKLSGVTYLLLTFRDVRSILICLWRCKRSRSIGKFFGWKRKTQGNLGSKMNWK